MALNRQKRGSNLVQPATPFLVGPRREVGDFLLPGSGGKQFPYHRSITGLSACGGARESLTVTTWKVEDLNFRLDRARGDSRWRQHKKAPAAFCLLLICYFFRSETRCCARIRAGSRVYSELASGPGPQFPVLAVRHSG